MQSVPSPWDELPPHGYFSSFASQLKCHLLRTPYPDHPSKQMSQGNDIPAPCHFPIIHCNLYLLFWGKKKISAETMTLFLSFMVAVTVYNYFS